MIGFMERGNHTNTSSHLNAIIALMSTMIPYFHVKSFTVITNEGFKPWMIEFEKMASARGFKMNFESKYGNYSARANEDVVGYLVMTDEFKVNHTKITENSPKLIVAVFFVNNDNFDIPEFVQDIVIPYRTSFFIVQLVNVPSNSLTSEFSSSIVLGKCVRVYKPTEEVPIKVFPTLYYGGTYGSDLRWHWEAPGLTWRSYRKDTKNMTGITVKLGFVSYLTEEKVNKFFRAPVNSFYWYLLKNTLGFEMNYHIERIPADNLKNWELMYQRNLKDKIIDGMVQLTVTSSERNKFTDFVAVGLDSKYNLYVKVPKFVYSWRSVVKPFALISWLCLFLHIILISVIFWIINSVHKTPESNFHSCFFTIFGFVCLQGSEKIPRHCSVRVVCYTGLLLSVLVSQYYTSNLYSILSTKQAHLPFTSIEDFLNKGTHTLYISPHTAIYPLIKNAEKGLLKEIWDRALKNNPHHKFQPSIPSSLSGVCKGKGAQMGILYQDLLWNEAPICPTVPTSFGFFPTNMVILTRRSYPFKPQFKQVILRSLEVGLSHKFRDDHLHMDHKKIPETYLTNEPVGLEQVGLLFIIYGGFILISCIILTFEIYHAKRSLKSRRISARKRRRIFLATPTEHNLMLYP